MSITDIDEHVSYDKKSWTVLTRVNGILSGLSSSLSNTVCCDKGKGKSRVKMEQ